MAERAPPHLVVDKAEFKLLARRPAAANFSVILPASCAAAQCSVPPIATFKDFTTTNDGSVEIVEKFRDMSRILF